jgi:hypothetical protein
MNQNPVGWNSSMEFGQICWMSNSADIDKLSSDVVEFRDGDKGHPVLMFPRAVKFKSVNNTSSMPLYRDQFSVPLIEYLQGVVSAPGTLVGDWMCGSGAVSEASWRRGHSVVAVDNQQAALDLTFERLTGVAEVARMAGDDYQPPPCPVNQLGCLLPNWVTRDVEQDCKDLDTLHGMQARMAELEEKQLMKESKKVESLKAIADKKRAEREEKEFAELKALKANAKAPDVASANVLPALPVAPAAAAPAAADNVAPNNDGDNDDDNDDEDEEDEEEELEVIMNAGGMVGEADASGALDDTLEE